MKFEFLKAALNMLTHVKGLMNKEYTIQRDLDKQFDAEIITDNRELFKIASSTDTFMKRSRHIYGFCLRRDQYNEVSRFHDENDLTRNEVAAALKTRLIKFKGRKGLVIDRSGTVSSQTLLFGAVSLAVTTAWYLLCKYYLLQPQALMPFDSTFAILFSKFVYLALSGYLFFYVGSYYVNAFFIRKKFRDLNLIK